MFVLNSAKSDHKEITFSVSIGLNNKTSSPEYKCVLNQTTKSYHRGSKFSFRIEYTNKTRAPAYRVQSSYWIQQQNHSDHNTKLSFSIEIKKRSALQYTTKQSSYWNQGHITRAKNSVFLLKLIFGAPENKNSFWCWAQLQMHSTRASNELRIYFNNQVRVPTSEIYCLYWLH